jgi:hypothetical protein
VSLTRAEVEEARKLAEAATEGPWKYASTDDASGIWPFDIYSDAGPEEESTVVRAWDSCAAAPDCGVIHKRDAEFIAASRSLLPAALDTIEELVGLLREVMAPLNDHTYMGHAHQLPGVWDYDNGPERAGKPCEQCALHDRVNDLLATVDSPSTEAEAR